MSQLIPIFQALNEAKITYVIVGGLAVVLHGHPRLTADLDIVISLDRVNIERTINVLVCLGFSPRVPVNAKDFADPQKRREWVEEKGMLMLSMYHPANPLNLIDIFIDYPIPFEQLLNASVIKDLGDLRVRVCSIDHLIEMKQNTGRAKDREDVRILKLLKGYEQ